MSDNDTDSPGETQPRKIYALVDQITPSTYRMSHSIFKPNFFLRRKDRKIRKGPELIKDSQKEVLDKGRTDNREIEHTTKRTEISRYWTWMTADKIGITQEKAMNLYSIKRQVEFKILNFNFEITRGC